MLLVEDNFDNIQMLTESVGDEKKLYLEGVFSVAGDTNRNRRTYSTDQLKTSVNQINESAESGRHILGELDHPSGSTVSLSNVSHKIIEAKADGNTGYSKMEILENTPKGSVAKALIESGVQLGISTRGSGKVNKSTGVVENYKFHTIDLVANPSCQSAYPQTIREQMEEYDNAGEIENLSEAVVHDPLAQAYFQKEMQRFIRSLYN